ncbi:MAG: FEA1-related lipoprotein [Candidatus Thermoplasmatota archaeon]|nr:FEA1-related lipoprotein [Candidatus Thermoplasmatota archaeon]
MNLKITSIMMTMMFLLSALAGCTGGDEAVDLDDSDGGYDYASNVDNHRMLMGDVCDIKDLSGAYDWDGVMDIYENGEHAEKSDGSYRTLMGFADAAGKNHAYDDYYGADGSWNDFVSAAIGGTGPFAGESDTVRDQATEKGIQNGVMTAYAIHELNAAIIKAEAGNWGPDDAQHAWDEGWAFYHGPDDADADYDGCGPFATAAKRGGNFGTGDATNIATLAAMNDGLTALKNEDMQGVIDARDEVLKNVVIVYSQASVRYASKMTDDLAAGDTADYDKHQAEGHAFYRVIEAYVAEYTSICYNMVSHSVSSDSSQASCEAYMYLENYTSQNDPDGEEFTGCYNSVTHAQHEGMSQEECEAFGWYANYYNSKILEIFDLKNDGDATADYEADIRSYLQPVWDAFGITADDIGTLQ